MTGGRDTPVDSEDWPVYGDGNKALANSPEVETPDLLDLNQARTIGRNIFQASTNWLNAGRRLKWNDSLRAFQGLHPNSSKYLSNDYRYRSRLFRPKTRAMVRKAEASTAQAFFANEDIVSIAAMDDNDQFQQASAEINKQLVQYRLTKTIPWFLTLVGARQDAEVMGVCIGKSYWKYAEKKTDSIKKPMLDPETGMRMLDENGVPNMEDYDVFTKLHDHPVIDLIAPENFRFDSAADWRNPVATSPYTVEMIPMYISDVMERIKSGEWLQVAESSLRGAVDLDDDATRRSREQGRVPGKDQDTWKPREFDICWIRENIVRWKGKEWHYYTLSSGGEMLSRPRPLEEVYLQAIRPYVVGFVLPEAHKVYPSSKVELIRDLQTQVNDVTNLRLDNVKLALNPRQFMQTGIGVDPQDLRTFNPGKVTIVNTKGNPAEAIMWDRPPEVTASSFQEHDRLNMDLDELVGGTSQSSMQANPQAYKTVGNMELMDGNASQLEEYDQRVFTETFVEPLIRHLVKLEQAYETDAMILAIAGKKAQLYQKFGMNEITDDLLKQELTVRVNVGLGATNPDKKLKNFVTAAQVVSQIFGPAAAMGAKFEEVIKEIFSLCGYKDGQRFFEDGFNVHQAQQQLAQGKGGKGQEDTQGKIALAQAQQQAQGQQDQEYHRMEMEENQKNHEYKMMEMQQKFQLEMEKERNKLVATQHQHMQEMASRPSPAVNVNSDALSKSSKDMHGIAEKHHQSMNNLHQVLTPLAHATIKHGETLQQLMQHTASGHNSLAAAIEKLAHAHSQPKKRRFLRDENGKAIGAEEYV